MKVQRHLLLQRRRRASMRLSHHTCIDSVETTSRSDMLCCNVLSAASCPANAGRAGRIVRAAGSRAVDVARGRQRRAVAGNGRAIPPRPSTRHAGVAIDLGSGVPPNPARRNKMRGAARVQRPAIGRERRSHPAHPAGGVIPPMSICVCAAMVSVEYNARLRAQAVPSEGTSNRCLIGSPRPPQPGSPAAGRRRRGLMARIGDRGSNAVPRRSTVTPQRMEGLVAGLRERLAAAPRRRRRPEATAKHRMRNKLHGSRTHRAADRPRLGLPGIRGARGQRHVRRRFSERRHGYRHRHRRRPALRRSSPTTRPLRAAPTTR